MNGHDFVIREPQGNATHGEIWMDGAKLTYVTGYEVRSYVGEANRVTVTFLAASINKDATPPEPVEPQP